MTMQYVPKLGELCGPDARRDAVHIAVAPVVAAEQLRPGQHVGLDRNGHATESEEFIGIVDPLLTGWVGEGDRFLLWLYPNTVTSLRHVWTHPAFAAKAPLPQEAVYEG